MASVKTRKGGGRKKLYKKRNTRKKIRKTKKGGDIAYYPLRADARPILMPPPSENLICSDTNNVCLAFGDLTEDIKTFFNGFGFTDTDYAVPELKRIGTPSDNGFITQIKYEKQGYNSYAVLKSAADAAADNLMYEYEVGLYINKVNKIYPCFIETYGLYKYTDPNWWEHFHKNAKLDKSDLNQSLKKQSSIESSIESYKIACTESHYLAILIQHLKGVTSLEDLSRDSTFIKNELMSALFQLYVPLAQLMNNFTHYDLNLNNIQMYQPDKNKYIQYYYHLTTGVIVSFKSSYMLKIIDYGHCYFNDEESGINSKGIYDKLCAEPECEYCGYDSGFNWLSNEQSDAPYYVSPQNKNISHDLSPLKDIYTNISSQRNISRLNGLLKKVVYTGELGTPENATMGYPRSINNVEDAAKCIIDEIISDYFQVNNEIVNSSKSNLGNLHIYMDGATPMKFTSENIVTVSKEEEAAEYARMMKFLLKT